MSGKSWKPSLSILLVRNVWALSRIRQPNPLNLKATMWLYSAQNVVNIPANCSYTGELICPQMPQNEDRNISTDSSSRIVHLQGVLPTNFTIFSSISMIMASIAQQWVFVPRIFAALDFSRKNRLTRNTRHKSLKQEPFVLNFLQISYIHSWHLRSHLHLPLSFLNVEPGVFWSSETAVIPKSTLGKGKITQVFQDLWRVLGI